MKKLLYITNSYPFGPGESTFVLPELKVLRHEFDITLVSCGPGNQQLAVPEKIKLLHYTSTSLSRVFNCIGSLFDPLFWRETHAARKTGGIRGIKRCLIHSADARSFGRWLSKRTDTADVIYSFWHTAPLTGVLLNKKRLGNPLVVTRAHGYDLYHFRVPEGYQPYKRHSDRLIDRTYLISKAGYDYYIEHYSVSEPPKCSLRYLGTDNDRISPYEHSPVLRVYSCSNLLDIKRVNYIIEALALIEMPIEWIHFGGGPLEDELRSLAEEKLSGKPGCKYTLTGAVPNDELKEYVAAHSFDCFISASSTEGLPVSIMEAASFAIPSVATDAGGTNELVNSETGILLPVELTPADLANALVRLKSMSAEETRAMRKAAYDRWKNNFVASDNARSFCAELLELCENR